MDELRSGEGWRWFGYAGHLIVGKDCAYHLVTLLPNGYLVSTVGHYLAPNGDDEPTEIGAGRTFETMVFTCDGVTPEGDPNITSWMELDMVPYTDSRAAEQGHYCLCHAWAVKERTPCVTPS
jgi:hypothetical protein